MLQPAFEQIKSQFDRYVIGNYARNPVAFVRGEGSHIWDSEGHRYIDLMPGWGTTTIGYCHPRVVAAVQRQAALLMHVDNSFYNPPQGMLAEALSTRSFGGRCFFCNSGAEAIEASLKLARLWGVERGKHEIITMSGSFHGRTFGAISATGQAKYHRGYLPLLPGIRHVPFNDPEALEGAVTDRTCAVLLEPIQGEGGIHVAGTEYLKAVRALCDRRNMLLIFDEVQTGMGRTGSWFAHQALDVQPDIMALAKALGGGFPIGAMTAREDVAAFLAPGTHAATFGGSPLACSAAIAVFETIEDEDLLTAGQTVSEALFERLHRMAGQYGIVRGVRGMGLMAGIELGCCGQEIFQECLAHHVRVNCTQETIIRMLPSLNIGLDTLHEGLDILEHALRHADR